MKKGSEQTYEVLKKRIVAGHYTAGTQLKEEHIAEDMGVSRTPVRPRLSVSLTMAWLSRKPAAACLLPVGRDGTSRTCSACEFGSSPSPRGLPPSGLMPKSLNS
ncbi:GntR family transcriptional regulator [Cupriavidus basilensis]